MRRLPDETAAAIERVVARAASGAAAPVTAALDYDDAGVTVRVDGVVVLQSAAPWP